MVLRVVPADNGKRLSELMERLMRNLGAMKADVEESVGPRAVEVEDDEWL